LGSLVRQAVQQTSVDLNMKLLGVPLPPAAMAPNPASLDDDYSYHQTKSVEARSEAKTEAGLQDPVGGPHDP